MPVTRDKHVVGRIVESAVKKALNLILVIMKGFFYFILHFTLHRVFTIETDLSRAIHIDQGISCLVYLNSRVKFVYSKLLFALISVLK